MTKNHNYNQPKKETADWHIPLNSNFEQLDTDVEIRDTEANLNDYDPKGGAKFLSVDTGRTYLGDGSSWSQLPIPSNELSVFSNIIHDPNSKDWNAQKRPMVSTDNIEITVDPVSGDDSDSGTSSDPLASLTEALSRIPYIVMHPVRIYLEPGDYTHEAHAINGPICQINFVKGLNGKENPFVISGNPGDPSQVRLSSTSFINFAFNGHVPYRTIIEGIQFDGMLQNYNGTFCVQDCRFTGNMFGVHAVDGYAGFTMIKDCWIGGNVDRAFFANQGHQIYVSGCTGSVDEIYREVVMGKVEYSSNNSISGSLP